MTEAARATDGVLARKKEDRGHKSFLTQWALEKFFEVIEFLGQKVLGFCCFCVLFLFVRIEELLDKFERRGRLTMDIDWQRRRGEATKQEGDNVQRPKRR